MRHTLWRLALATSARCLEALVGISRDELVIGGRAFYKTRPPSPGGVNTTWRLEPVKVLEVNRGGAKIERGNKKIITAPFGMLEPDEGFLTEHERKEAQKKKRIEQERLLSEQMLAVEPKPLTYTLADKLSHLESKSDDYAGPVASDVEREDALSMLEALRLRDLVSTAPPAPRAALFDELAQRREQKQALLEVDAALPEPPKPPPPPAPPAPEPKRAPPLPLLNHLPPPPPPPLSPLQQMLGKVQAELEQLIAEEAEIEPEVVALKARAVALASAVSDEQMTAILPAPHAEAVRAYAQKLAAERDHPVNLSAALRVVVAAGLGVMGFEVEPARSLSVERDVGRQHLFDLEARLGANRARQKVLAAQERMVLAKVQGAPPAAAAQKPSVATPEPAKEALPPLRSTTPTTPLPKKRGRPVGSKNKPKVPATLREVYQAADVARAPAASAGPGPGWLRRRASEQGAAE